MSAAPEALVTAPMPPERTTPPRDLDDLLDALTELAERSWPDPARVAHSVSARHVLPLLTGWWRDRAEVDRLATERDAYGRRALAAEKQTLLDTVAKQRLMAEVNSAVAERDAARAELAEALTAAAVAVAGRREAVAGLAAVRHQVAEIHGLVDRYNQGQRSAFDRGALAGAVVRTVEHHRAALGASPSSGDTGRCPDCDHLVHPYHHAGSGCWYTVTAGPDGGDHVCPCALPPSPTSGDPVDSIARGAWQDRACGPTHALIASGRTGAYDRPPVSDEVTLDLGDLRTAVIGADHLPDSAPVLVQLPDGSVCGLVDAGPGGTCDGEQVFRLTVDAPASPGPRDHRGGDAEDRAAEDIDAAEAAAEAEGVRSDGD